MRARFFSFLMVFSCITAIVPAQSYTKLWKEVEAMQKLDRPKSALDLTRSIFQKAQQEQNVSEMLRAYVEGMEFREKITPDSLSRDIEGFEKWLSGTKEPLDAAVLHSVLAEMYADYFSSHPLPSYRAIESSVLPSDLSEWSGTVFIQKIFGHLRASLKDKRLLEQTNVDAFKPIIEKGATSDYFKHDLFHLLGQRAITILSPLKWRANDFYSQTVMQQGIDFPTTTEFLAMQIPQASEYDCLGEMFRIYQSMLHYYTEKGNLPASVLVDLDRIVLAHDNMNTRASVNANSDWIEKLSYMVTLRELAKHYAQTDVCAEVYKKMADFALQSGDPALAMEIAEDALRKYPSYHRIDLFRQLKADILQPRLSGQSLETVYPGKEIALNINYCNLNGFTLKLYKVNLPAVSTLLDDPSEKTFRSKYTKFEKGIHYSLASTPDYRNRDTTLLVVAPSEGIWLLEAVPDVKAKSGNPWLIYVTDLSVINRTLPGNISEFVVVNAQTGFPVSQADVILYQRDADKMNVVVTLKTDEKGSVTRQSESRYDAYRAQKGNDTAMPLMMNGMMRYGRSNYTNASRNLSLFTDRSIYRPGQMVYVAGIAYRMDGDSTQVLANADYTLTLYDVNQKILAEKKVKTNDFGSFAGEFQLPSPCLTGSFSIKAGSARAWFRVDEYKRPTFDVIFDPVQATYSVGDSIRITGMAKTYSGVPVQHAEVKYTFKISYPYWLRRGSDVNISSGSVETNDEGTFSVSVYLEPQTDKVRIDNFYYNYLLNADVTDNAGETQSGSVTIPSGKNSLVVSCTVPQNLQKEGNDSLTVNVRNLNGEPQAVNGVMEVYKLSPGLDPYSPVMGERVLQEPFVANKQFKPASVLSLPSGMYRLVFAVKDREGNEIKDDSDFVLYSLNDRKPPYNVQSWFQVVKREFSTDSPAVVLFGSSLKDVYVLYDVFAGEKRLESKRIMLNDSVLKMVYPYKPDYGDGIFVQFAFVKDGKLYEESTAITKALPDKRLIMKWETFRDKLRPGQQEEWKLQIVHPDGKPADAELLATMYDASLDKLAKHNWFFNLYFPRQISRIDWRMPYPQTNFFSVDFLLKQWKYRVLAYDKFIFGPLSRVIMQESEISDMNVPILNTYSRSGRPAMKAMGVMADAPINAVPESEQGSGGELQPAEDIEIRDNFAETAFFYPQLHTDKQGNVTVSFLLPQSLTQWKFMGFSHTRTMDWGKIEATATASKDFMISPNMPRFVRVGDQVSIAANIINLTGKEISGQSVMELFNPENEKVIYSQKQSFSVKAGETTVVNFNFTAGENYPGLLACRMTAKGNNFSDGEQRFLPVLSNKQQITESVPMDVEGKGTREFSLTSLFNHNSKSATDRKLTVEFTGNPAWYAVQALPTLSNPTNDNAISWASAYYANAAASYIANANPRIKAVFDSWKQQGGTKETLLSNLEKNQELKNILLDETPWAVEATNETEQKQRIATLFDLNTIQYANSIAINKLKTLQQNGAWSWYKGMGVSPYVTLFVTEALGRIPVLTGKPLPQDALGLQDASWTYLHREAQTIYTSLLKSEKSGITGQGVPDFILRYLYLGAITGEDIQKINRDAYSYFIDRIARTITAQDLYQKALSAVILQKAGKTAEATNFITSLKEYSVQTPGMGIYYDSKSAPYSVNSYRIPTQVVVLEAMQIVAKDLKTVEQMKIWLLRQKQAQSWDSPLATVNAIYALLNRGTDLLTNDDNVRIILGKQVIQTNQEKNLATGLGYVKEMFTGNELKPDMTKVTVEKQSEGISWGAVYAQYLEKIDQVSKQGGPLSVDKALFVERMVNNRPVLTPLKEAGKLTVGDKVVSRITVKSDRDMDFIQLKDSRAACLEPVNTLSGYRYINNTGCYVAVKDASTEFFFDGLRKGTYVIEYTCFVTRTGDYTGGIATLQSAYAPEFAAHSASEPVKVTK